jgi:hypothetical protein
MSGISEWVVTLEAHRIGSANTIAKGSNVYVMPARCQHLEGEYTAIRLKYQSLVFATLIGISWLKLLLRLRYRIKH